MTYRIGIGGISTESSTFAPHRTGLDDFLVQRGPAELAKRYPFLENWRLPGYPDVEFVPLLQARALPGGQVTPEAYDTLAAELLDRLRTALASGPLDGFYLDIHGAMAVDGRRDAEAALAREIRALTGPECLLSASMDLHGQVSHEFGETVELITAFRTAPHVDYEETRERAVGNLAYCLTQEVRPVRARVRIPVLLPGEKTSTRVEPARSVYASLADTEALPGVLDASLLVGYAWADEGRSAATALVYGTDAAVVSREAERIARAWWDARDRFEFCAPAGPADWAIEQAFASAERPFFVSDSGDNPTGGGSNDTAAFLDALLARPELTGGRRSAIWASCVAPDAVRTCFEAGTGAQVTAQVGGHYERGNRAGDDRAGDNGAGGQGTGQDATGRDRGTPDPREPTLLTGEVYRLHEETRMGTHLRVAVVRSGGVHAVLTSGRRPYHTVADLLELGLDPAGHDLTAIKIGYLQPDLFAAAQGWVLALTPGGVDQDLKRLGYREVVRPLHPLDTDIPAPDLNPVLLGP